MGSSGSAPVNVYVNSPHEIMSLTGFLSTNALFGVMIFCVIGFLRDREHRIENIIYSTPVKKSHFFLSRFLGVFLVSLISFSALLPGFMIGFMSPFLEPEKLTSFDFMSYFWPWLLIVVPNILMATSIVFAITVFSKNRMYTYVGAVFVYTLYILGSSVLNSPIISGVISNSAANQLLAALIDPFGLIAVFEQTYLWTAIEKNSLLISFSGNLMWNRILWIGLSMSIAFIAYRFFSFKIVNAKTNKEKSHDYTVPDAQKYRPVSINASSAKQQFNALMALIRLEVKTVFKNLPFLALIVFWIITIIPLLVSALNGGGIYGESIYPSTNLFIDLYKDNLLLFSFILITIYGSELIWKERALQVNSIIDATLVSNATLFGAKCIALLFIPFIVASTGFMTSIIFQFFAGYYHIQPALYASTFYFYGVQLFFYCFLLLFIHTLIPHKYLSMGVAASLYIIFVMTPMSALIGMEHPLLRVGSLPIPGYTNMNGFLGAKAFNHFAIYWGALGGILVLFSFKFWQRGIHIRLKQRVIQAYLNTKKWERAALIMFAFAFIASGANIYRNTNILTEYQTVDDRLLKMEKYEKKFKSYAQLESLYPVSVKTELDLFPKSKAYNLKANYILQNKGVKPVDSVFITEREALVSISLDDAQLIEHDSELGTYLFKLNTPLLPDEKILFRYEINKKETGYERDISIVPNGTYMSRYASFEPVIGYTKSMEISDYYERKKRGLPQSPEQSLHFGHLDATNPRGSKVSFETIISTDANQIALSTGELVKEWTIDNRKYFHYKTVNDVEPTGVYMSADYAVKKTKYRDIDVEQYYYPKHDYNIDVIEESVINTLSYCIDNFGDYPRSYIRIAEVPGHWAFGGAAHPGLISMVEDRLYLIDNRSVANFDLVAKRTIHEVSHQWWGGILSPKYVEGGSMFTEGFAKYTEAMLIEKQYGKGAIWQLSETANNLYFNGRAFARQPETPLYLSKGQSYLAYGKNYSVMLALEDLIGEEKLNQVLKTLVDRFKDDDEKRITSLEFIDELYRVVPEPEHRLIDDWFKRIITYDLSVTNVSTQPLDDGTYKLNVSVAANRFETQSNGQLESIGIDESIKIGLFNTHPKYVVDDSSIIHLQNYTINKSEMTLEIIVNQIPSHISIDPFGTRSDKDFLDNTFLLDK